MNNSKSRLAHHLFLLRRKAGWSLDRLAQESKLSRASLSRIENAEVSPTAETLTKLCAVFEIPVSRLMARVEGSFPARIAFEDQSEWQDAETGITRRTVSPSSPQLSAAIDEVHLSPGSETILDTPSRPGQEHHLIMLDGMLEVSFEGASYQLTAGDCLRFQFFDTARMETPQKRGARYMLVTL